MLGDIKKARMRELHTVIWYGFGVDISECTVPIKLVLTLPKTSEIGG